MRKSVRTLTAVVSLVAVLGITTPLFARDKGDERGGTRTRESIGRTVKKIVKRVFGISVNEIVTPPHPEERANQ